VTYQTGQDAVVRAQFITNGVLANTEDTNLCVVSDDWPVFAFAHILCTVSTTATNPVIYTVAHVRDPAIQSIIANDIYQPEVFTSGVLIQALQTWYVHSFSLIWNDFERFFLTFPIDSCDRVGIRMISHNDVDCQNLTYSQDIMFLLSPRSR